MLPFPSPRTVCPFVCPSWPGCVVYIFLDVWFCTSLVNLSGVGLREKCYPLFPNIYQWRILSLMGWNLCPAPLSILGFTQAWSCTGFIHLLLWWTITFILVIKCLVVESISFSHVVYIQCSNKRTHTHNWRIISQVIRSAICWREVACWFLDCMVAHSPQNHTETILSEYLLGPLVLDSFLLTLNPYPLICASSWGSGLSAKWHIFLWWCLQGFSLTLPSSSQHSV